MKPKNTFLIFSVILFLHSILGINPSWGESDSDDLDIRDSLILLKNILKDISKEKEIEDQYKLFIRAELLYKGISKSLSGNETAALKKKLKSAFKRLPPPSEVSSPRNLKFKLISGVESPFYWSSAITEEMFVEFLNDTRKTKDYLDQNLDPKSHSISHKSEFSQMLSNDPNAFLESASYFAAKDFALWLTKTVRNPFFLPSRKMVKASGEKKYSGWTKSTWKSKDAFLIDAWEMFGGEFLTVFLKGEAVGELPEACYPYVRIKLAASISTGKKLFISNIRSDL